MNTELTELVFVLDRCGSMGGLESDTIGGFNGMTAKQKAQGKKMNMTTILFDGEVDINHDRFSIEIMNHLQKHLPEHHLAEKIIFVITTNELENSSEYFI